MSETADRWWVRVAARWLARIDGVSGQLRLAMLVMTGLSTATVALQNAGLQRFALPLIGVTGVGLAVGMLGLLTVALISPAGPTVMFELSQEVDR